MKLLAALVIFAGLLSATTAEARHHHHGYHAVAVAPSIRASADKATTPRDAGGLRSAFIKSRAHKAAILLPRARPRNAPKSSQAEGFWGHATAPLGLVMPDDCPQARINAVFATLGVDPWR